MPSSNSKPMSEDKELDLTKQSPSSRLGKMPVTFTEGEEIITYILKKKKANSHLWFLKAIKHITHLHKIPDPTPLHIKENKKYQFQVETTALFVLYAAINHSYATKVHFLCWEGIKELSKSKSSEFSLRTQKQLRENTQTVWLWMQLCTTPKIWDRARALFKGKKKEKQKLIGNKWTPRSVHLATGQS